MVVLAYDTLTRADEVPCWIGGLDLEHDRNVSFVDQLDRRRGPFVPIRSEADMGDRVQRDKLTPVLLLSGRPLRCLLRLHRHCLP